MSSRQQGQAQGGTRPGLRWGAGLALLLVLGTVAGAWLLRWPRRADPTPAAFARTTADPRLAYTGPFRNVHPDVGHAGDAACAGCHADVCASYRLHPMGRSLAPAGEVPDSTGPDPSRHNPFLSVDSRFEVAQRGPAILHRQTRLDRDGRDVYTLEHEVRYVIGSGTRGRSYLSERGGFLFQTPISWYSQKGIWDRSPGFTAALLPGRPVPADCLFCHANRTRPREDVRNSYDSPVFDGFGIGCERCHGPGELHVRERTRSLPAGSVDDTIVNPKHLEPDLREAVCAQCHLSGEARVLRRGRGLYDFRPGLPLHSFWSVFVKDRSAGANVRAVNHVEQMHLSRCYRESRDDRKLGCASCHDPHARIAPERRAAWYRGKCQACHDDRQLPGCSLAAEQRRKEADNCIACHMPSYATSDIAHAAATDHHILRRRDPAPPAADGADLSLIAFPGAGPEAGAPEAGRDLGIALARQAADGRPGAARAAGRAADLLAEALAGCPEDVPAWEARGQALVVLGRRPEALAAYEGALERAPRREAALLGAARLAQDSGLLDKALVYWGRAVEVDPWAADSHGNLALLLAHTGAWEEARIHCRTWLSLDPGSVEARKLWVRCLFRAGDRDAARAEMDVLDRLR